MTCSVTMPSVLLRMDCQRLSLASGSSKSSPVVSNTWLTFLSLLARKVPSGMRRKTEEPKAILA